MKRKGRILIVDDEGRWLEVLQNILIDEGYQVDAVTTVDGALECLARNFYHLAVLDIRMEAGDRENAEGMRLLDQLDKSGILEAMEVIMLSAYGTKAQMREAFARHKVADFLSKDEFDNLEFIQRFHEVFSNKVRVNLDLKIHWQQIKGPEQVIVNLNYEGSRIKRSSSKLAEIAVELDDLLCRLFYKAESLLINPLTSGQSGSAVLIVTPFYTAGAGHPVIVKFGDIRDIDVEYKNFKEYVQSYVGGGRSTNIIELRRTPHLGGIVYSLLGSASDQLESFSSFYLHAEASQINEVLSRLFHETCGAWYASPGRLQPHDLAAEYQRNLGFSPERLDQAVEKLMRWVGGKNKLQFKCLTDSNQNQFTNPLLAIADQNFVRPTYICTTHGDLNGDNIMVDGAGSVWLIDFQSTGAGHILRDIAELESVVRFQLLDAGEATLDERLEMEKALCSIIHFSQVEELNSRFMTENKALAKAFAVTTHLRALAHRLVIQNPSDDISEYYIALLFYALNILRFYALSPIQRQHALLSASLLADRLGL